MSHDKVVAPSAAPKTTAAAGVPARLAEPVRSLATIVATVTAAMWPVLPRATPPTSDQTVRRRSRSSSAGLVVATRLVTDRAYGRRGRARAMGSQSERQRLVGARRIAVV